MAARSKPLINNVIPSSNNVSDAKIPSVDQADGSFDIAVSRDNPLANHAINPHLKFTISPAITIYLVIVI